MSFLNIEDPKKRDAVVAEYLATVKRIQNRNFQDRAKDFAYKEGIEQSLKPVIQATATSTDAITKELIPIKEGITNLNIKLGNRKRKKDEDVETAEEEEEEEEKEEVNILEEIWKEVSSDKLDTYFGIIQTSDGHYRMGAKHIYVEGNDILVDGTRYVGTHGLWVLIMFKKPQEESYTEHDLLKYRELVEQTDAMNSPNNVRNNSRVESTYKWRNIFSQFSSSTQQQHGGNGVVEFLPGDIKGLQTKLGYLLGEYRAGNKLATRNQIVAIADELLRRKHLSRNEYREINNFIQQQQQQ